MTKYINADIWRRLPNDLPYKASVKRVLIQAPAADVVEVKHGEWIAHNKTMYGSDYSCSLCGNIADEDNRGKFAILTKYCSNCGAKMDGGNT
jgi:hypothetical protein